MARYIDADKFLQDEIKRCGCVPLVGSCTTDNESLAYQLAKASTADVVEVVRCKDCKHMRETAHQNYCLPIFGLKQITDLNSFCSYGERKYGKDTNVISK